MNYKIYPTSKETAVRMARKRARADTFLFNSKAKKKQRKEERNARKQSMGL